MFSWRIYLNAAKSEKARSYRRKNCLTPVALATGWKQTRRGALHSAPAEKVNTAQLQQVSPQKQAHVAQRSFFFVFFISTREVVTNVTRRRFNSCGKWSRTGVETGFTLPAASVSSRSHSVFGTGSAQSCHQEEGKKALRMWRADVSNDCCSRNQMQSAAARWKWAERKAGESVAACASIWSWRKDITATWPAVFSWTLLERCTAGLTSLRRLFADRKLDLGGVFHKIKLISPPLFFFVAESGCYSFAVFVVVLLNLFVLALCLLSFCLSFWRCVGSLAVATAERLWLDVTDTVQQNIRAEEVKCATDGSRDVAGYSVYSARQHL